MPYSGRQPLPQNSSPMPHTKSSLQQYPSEHRWPKRHLSTIDDVVLGVESVIVGLDRVKEGDVVMLVKSEADCVLRSEAD